MTTIAMQQPAYPIAAFVAKFNAACKLLKECQFESYFIERTSNPKFNDFQNLQRNAKLGQIALPYMFSALINE